MVTFVSILTVISLLIFITVIDMFVLSVSFITALQMTFDIRLSIGGIYIISGSIFGLCAAMVIDYRLIRHNSTKKF